MDFTVEPFFLEAARAITLFRPAEVTEMCAGCPNFGCRWGCPPFGEAPLEPYRPYDGLTLYVLRVPRETDLMALRLDVERRLGRLEQQTGGRFCALPGDCPHCGSRPCTRPEGKPCRNPGAVRPSLEALGADVGALMHLAGAPELRWQGREMTVVAALWHPAQNRPERL